MRKYILPALCAFLLSCAKNDIADGSALVNYQIRVVAVDFDGTKTYTAISRVTSGKVAVEFATEDVANVKEFDVEVSSSGTNFQKIKTMAADVKSPNKIYSDTLRLP